MTLKFGFLKLAAGNLWFSGVAQFEWDWQSLSLHRLKKNIIETVLLSKESVNEWSVIKLACFILGEFPLFSDVTYSLALGYINAHQSLRHYGTTNRRGNQLYVSLNQESLENLHTYAVDSAIQIMGNNRVLKDRSPPITGKKKRLNHNQRFTL